MDTCNPFLSVIDSEKENLISLADYVWENPELAFHEFKSSAALISFLKEHGFTIEQRIGGQMHVGCWVPGSVNHSWHTVAQGKNGYARRAMLYTGKALALAAVRLMQDPELLKAAKAEHFAKTKGKYEPAMPPDVMPPV